MGINLGGILTSHILSLIIALITVDPFREPNEDEPTVVIITPTPETTPMPNFTCLETYNLFF